MSSAHRIAFDLHNAPEAADPGNAKTITVNRSPQVVALVSAAAETRTLARPTRAGAVCHLYMKTDNGDIVLTVTGGYNESGDTTFTFSDPGQFLELVACFDGTNYFWRKTADYSTGNLGIVTATAAELNALAAFNAALATSAGTAISGSAETYKNAVLKVGTKIQSDIIIDITGLDAIATDGDVIGKSTAPAHIGQITTARSGTPAMIRMTCLEAPAGASLDIDLFTASVATGKLDDAMSGLTGQAALITAGGNWANGTVKGATAMPAAGDYLYLANGAGANAGTYSAGKFLIEIYGYG